MDGLITLFSDPSAWVALATLIALEVVLGIDNLIFISILTNKLPEADRPRARRIGIGLALILRLALLSLVAFIVLLTEPVITLFGQGFSWRDIILIAGGLFLVWKATKEIHHSVDSAPTNDVFDTSRAGRSFMAIIGQIIAIDLVFSLDSIITAVGLTHHVPIMVIAVLVAVSVMLLAAGPLADFVAKNPTVVMLALSFLLMIGMTLIAEGFQVHVEKGFVYAAMAFSCFVEFMNILARKNRQKRGTAQD